MIFLQKYRNENISISNNIKQHPRRVREGSRRSPVVGKTSPSRRRSEQVGRTKTFSFFVVYVNQQWFSMVCLLWLSCPSEQMHLNSKSPLNSKFLFRCLFIVRTSQMSQRKTFPAIFFVASLVYFNPLLWVEWMQGRGWLKPETYV